MGFPKRIGAFEIDLSDEGGYRHAVCNTDDDTGSGYGDNAKVGYFYSQDKAVLDALTPADFDMQPRRTSEGCDPFDLACERRYD